MKLYVDEKTIGDDCAIAAFTAPVDPEQYKKKCSVLCVDSFDFLGTKYNGHLLSSLWRRVQMVCTESPFSKLLNSEMHDYSHGTSASRRMPDRK